MEKILGIIAEYNPFHSGHLYHITESKKQVNPDYTVAIMSGNFVERGETAILDKWSRAQMALKNGVDLVIELPVLYSISSAENFADGGIKILNSLKMDTTLSFGSECGNTNILDNISKVLIEEPDEYTSILDHELSKGVSYPKAREKAILMYLNDIRKYANVLSGPNNILGIEYLKAIQKTKNKISYVTVKRTSSYNSKSLEKNTPSATAIRAAISEGKDISKFVPEFTNKLLKDKINNGEFIPSINILEKAILYKLRVMSLEEISNLPDVSEGLENKLKKASDISSNLEELTNAIKSKRYTMSRINRILLYALLNITKADMEMSKKVTPYIRVLGVNKKGKELLSKLSNNNKKLQIITSPKKFLEKSNNKALKRMLEIDMLASNIYTLGYNSNSKSNLDFTKKLITD